MITGDNVLVATAVANSIGIDTPTVLTGAALRQLSSEALRQEEQPPMSLLKLSPIKGDIILALKRCGYVVGYIGDGINDALSFMQRMWAFP